MENLRRRVHDLLELDACHDSLTRTLNTGLMVLIFLNVLAFSVETVPVLAERMGGFFYTFNVFSVLIFTLEYVLRVWSCIEIPGLGSIPAWRA